MKLEPSRTSLSGRPDFLKPPEPIKTAITLKPRRCASCGCDDVIQTIHAEGSSRVGHKIIQEIRFLKDQSDCGNYLRSKGWEPGIHDGRPGMSRMICRVCLIAHELMEKEFRQKRSKEMRSSNHDTYYAAIAGE